VWWWIVRGGMEVSVWVLLPSVVWGVWVSMVVGVSGALWPWSWVVWWAIVLCFGWVLWSSTAYFQDFLLDICGRAVQPYHTFL
jgi:hypothetical protein